MVPRFGRALSGNDLEELNRIIERENLEFEDQRQNLIKELAYLIQEKELLKEKVKTAEAQLRERLALRNRIADQLYESYLLSIQKSAGAIRSVEESIKDLKNLLEIKNSELERLKASIGRMKEEFIGIAGRYENMLEKEERLTYDHERQR